MAATAVAKSAQNFYRLKSVGRSQGNRMRATSMTPQGDKNKGASCQRGELNRKLDRRQQGMSPFSHADEEKILLGQTKTVDTAQTAHQVLKMCGVVRDKLNLDQDFLRAGSGVGGGDRTYYRRTITRPTAHLEEPNPLLMQSFGPSG